MDDTILINEAKAHKLADALSDPVARNLVLFGIAEARMRVIRRTGQGEAQWRESLPQKPFDMEFYANVLAGMFSKGEILKGVLEGRSLAEASGWDV
jgi:hypothetical protein